MADILIVEDDKPISDLILMNLRLVGHSCRQAFDAREAEAEVAARRPDLVLLDLAWTNPARFAHRRRVFIVYRWIIM
jgi:DNA-binding response OmpR family regulator